jgi:hypothetical protein
VTRSIFGISLARLYARRKKAKKLTQNFIFFQFFCNLFYNNIILRKIRVAERVADGLQKDDGYTIRPLRLRTDDGVLSKRRPSTRDGSAFTGL